MGLDAVVYRNRNNLPFDPERVGACLDPRTGEYYFQDSTPERRFSEDALVALDKHLGNVNAIESLSQAVERSLGRRDSILQEKVLFSGTHAGDVIEPVDFDQLSTEIAEVRRSLIVNQMPELAEFIQSMEDLLKAAAKEENPIVFR